MTRDVLENFSRCLSRGWKTKFRKLPKKEKETIVSYWLQDNVRFPDFLYQEPHQTLDWFNITTTEYFREEWSRIYFKKSFKKLINE